MDPVDYKELTERIRLEVFSAVKQKRFEHSVRVAETASLMAGLYNQNKEKAYFAGLAHDMCKELSDEQMIFFAKKDGRNFSEIENAKLSLLHGRAAAVKLNLVFGVTDNDILEAVASHTFGKSGLSDLGKIIYAADKIEPGRPQSTDLYRERLFKLSLDELCISVVEENIEYLNQRGKRVAPVSLDFLNSLKHKDNV